MLLDIDRLPLERGDEALPVGDFLALVAHLVRILAEGAILCIGEELIIVPDVVLHGVILGDHRPQPVEFLLGCFRLVPFRLEVALDLHLCDIDHVVDGVGSVSASGAVVDGILAIEELSELVQIVTIVNVGDVEGGGHSGDT